MVPQKWVKGDLHIFHLNVAWLSLFWKNILLFSYVEPFGHDNLSNEDTVKFLAKFGAIFPISPK